MKRWWIKVLALLLVAALIWGALFALDPQRMPIATIGVEGDLHYLSRERLEQVVASHVKEGFFLVDLDAIRSAVMQLPWVKDVSIRRHWPGRLHLLVQEREAAARWTGGGLVDKQGNHFQPDGGGHPEGLPELEGADGTQPLLLERYREFHALLAVTGLKIRRLVMDSRHAWRLEMSSGTRLLLGQAPQIDNLGSFAAALPAIQAGRGEEIDKVDLRYPNGFTIRWRRTPDATSKGGQ